jgi:glutamyl-tRNA(Gln) amidotransferase subunit E
MDEYNLNKKLAMQIVDSKFGGLFEVIVKQNEVTATTVAVFLTETLKSLKRDGIAIEKVTSNQIKDIFRGVALEKLAKEAIPDVFIWFSQNEGKNLSDAIEALQLKMLSKEELTKLVNEVISENKPSVDKMGQKAYGILMSALMKEVRGKADPRIVSALLRERLN